MSSDKYIIPPKEGNHASGDWNDVVDRTNYRPKRTLVDMKTLSIDIYHERNPPQIWITDPSQVDGCGSIVAIPEDSILFRGTVDQFVDMLRRMKKKFGHLYE